MTNNEKIKTIIAVGVTVAALADTVRITRRERAKRAEIIADTNKQIDAIIAATSKVQARIDNGSYNNVDELEIDFNFEIIAARYTD